MKITNITLTKGAITLQCIFLLHIFYFRLSYVWLRSSILLNNNIKTMSFSFVHRYWGRDFFHLMCHNKSVLLKIGRFIYTTIYHIYTSRFQCYSTYIFRIIYPFVSVSSVISITFLYLFVGGWIHYALCYSVLLKNSFLPTFLCLHLHTSASLYAPPGMGYIHVLQSLRNTDHLQAISADTGKSRYELHKLHMKSKYKHKSKWRVRLTFQQIELYYSFWQNL